MFALNYRFNDILHKILYIICIYSEVSEKNHSVFSRRSSIMKVYYVKLSRMKHVIMQIESVDEE